MTRDYIFTFPAFQRQCNKFWYRWTLISRSRFPIDTGRSLTIEQTSIHIILYISIYHIRNYVVTTSFLANHVAISLFATSIVVILENNRRTFETLEIWAFLSCGLSQFPFVNSHGTDLYCTRLLVPKVRYSNRELRDIKQPQHFYH